MPGLSGYQSVAALLVVSIGIVAAIMLLTHLIGPKRRGAVKDSTYESGMTPVGDARRRFNVRFYLVAVMFLVFDVEIIFIYPWAVLLPRLHAEAGGQHAAWATAMRAGGYGPEFLFGVMLIFFAILLVGFIYEWRNGVFKWD